MKAIKSKPYNPDTAKKRLFYWLLIFFIGISLPVYFLLHKVYSQLQDETWYRQRNRAEQLVQRIERQLLEKLQPEQDRPIAEYSFFNVLENQLLQSASLNFSPLSEHPPKSDIPGLIGYFQIDPNGTFHIPALPELKTDLQSGLSAEAFAIRMALKDKLHGLLALNESAKQVISTDKQDQKELHEDKDSLAKPIVQTDRFIDSFQTTKQDELRVVGNLASKNQTVKKRIPNVAVKQESQELSEEKLQQLNIETTLWKQKRNLDETPSSSSYGMRTYKRDYRLQARKEMVKIPDQTIASEIFKRNKVAQRVTEDDEVLERESQIGLEKKSIVQAKLQKSLSDKLDMQQAVRILSFESEVSPLQMISLAQHLCFYRNAWNGKARYIQGLIVDVRFLQEIIQPIVNSSQSLSLSSVIIVDKGNVMQQFKTRAATSELLIFRRALLAPFQDMEIIVNSSGLTADSGKQGLDMVSIALALIIGAGFILFYRLGARQIELAKQQRNFISSVSHELKTPLTSIRMYSEILRSDWVVDASRKQSYYD